MSVVVEAREPSARYLEAVQPALVRQFDLVATAPGGVARLRELILTLAVRGKLVPQILGDEPASTLLKQIRAEKEQLISLGRIGREKAQPFTGEGVRTFDLPPTWRWASAADICAVITDGDHQAPPRAETGVPFLVISDVRTGEVGLNGATRVVPKEYFDQLDWSKKPRPGDVLYTTVGSFGIPVPILHAQNFCFQRHIALFRPGIPDLQKFLTLTLRSQFVFAQAERGATGIAQKTVPLSILRGLQLPIPPLGEQARIVARVDELMRLCDALEAKGRLEAEQHARLLGALLGTLTDSATPEELARNWQRVADHFDLLLDRTEAVDALEQTILQLAVRGLLVPQDPSDEGTDILLESVCVVRQRKQASGEVKASRSPSDSTTVEEPFALPAGWAWSSLPGLCAITGGSTPSKAVAGNWTGDIPWVSPKDMKVSAIHEAQDHVSPTALARGLSLIAPGSLLIVVRGMILAHSFPVAETKVPVTINQDMKALAPFEPSLLPFLMLVCSGMKGEILGLVERSTHGTCKLESSKIFRLPIPIPPLAEQARIVLRVAELRRLCTDLRQRLAVSQSTQAHLAEALVESAVA